PSIDKTATTGIVDADNGEAEAVTGESVTYEILVTVPEGADFTNGALTDDVPAGIRIDTVAITTPGGSPVGFPITSDDDSFEITWPSPYVNEAGVDQFLVTVGATVTATQTGPYVNTAVFTSSDGTSTDDAPITVIDDPVDPVDAPITLAKSADRATATIGDDVDYDLVVTVPASTEPRFDVTVLDTVPVGLAVDGLTGVTCDRAGTACGIDATELSAGDGSRTIGFSLGDLAADDTVRTVTITYRAVLTDTLTTDDVLTNTAVVVSNETDDLPDPADGDRAPDPDGFDDTSDPATSTVDVVEPRLVIDQDVNGQIGDTDERSVVPGEKLTYTITVTNLGDGPAFDVSIVDAIDPRLLDFVDMTAVGEGARLTDGDPSDGDVAWIVDGPIAPGASVTIEFMVMVPDVIVGSDEFVTDADIPTYTGVPDADSTNRTYGDDPSDDVVNDGVVVDVTVVPVNSSIGDTVWFDLDRDGIVDDDEIGISGVRIVVTGDGPDQLPGTADDIVRETITDQNGEYLVDGLPAGTYTVTLDETTLPGGVEQTFGLQGGTTSPSPTVTVELPASTERDDVDFGYVGLGSIGDTVWWDRDRDGVQSDATDGATREPGLAGVDVTVTYAGADETFGTADDITFDTTTDDDGRYLVTDLPAGTYRVDVDTDDLPDGFDAVYDEDDGLTDPDSTTIVDLGAAEDHRTADFGYDGEGRLGDTIYLDTDGDGTQDAGEPGIPGQRVVVTWEGPDGIFDTDDDEVFELLTDENGEYLLDGLPEDRFTVTVGTVGEPGITATATNTEDPDGGTPNTSEVDLGGAGGDERLDQDFGYQGVNSLGDLVWLDTDADGEPAGDTTEPGIADVAITVTWFGNDGVEGTADDVLVATTTTDDDGLYLVENLPDGTFRTTVDASTVPDGLGNTNDRGDAANGPTEPTDGSSVTTLTADRSGASVVPDVDLDQDFGYVDGGSISGTIVLDLDDSESADPGEGIPGVLVQLVDPGPDGVLGGGDDVVLDERTTDDDGDYTFPGLGAGDYVVVVDPDGDTLPEGTRPNFDSDASTGTAEPGDGDLVMPVTLEGAPDGTVGDVVDVDAGVIGDGTIGD
ncbi:MAG: SdrD B-like domain-containing protein, partial [Actinomycetota bacterium]